MQVLTERAKIWQHALEWKVNNEEEKMADDDPKTADDNMDMN